MVLLKVLDFLNKIGFDQLITYEIHWDVNHAEVIISSDFIDAIIDLFADYYLKDEDSIFISRKKEKTVLELYVYKP